MYIFSCNFFDIWVAHEIAPISLLLQTANELPEIKMRDCFCENILFSLVDLFFSDRYRLEFSGWVICCMCDVYTPQQQLVKCRVATSTYTTFKAFKHSL